MRRRIIEYKLIVEEYDSSLNTKINRLLGEGWELYGGPAVATKQYTTKLTQAMVRYMEEPTTPDVPEPRNHYPEGMFTL